MRLRRALVVVLAGWSWTACGGGDGAPRSLIGVTTTDPTDLGPTAGAAPAAGGTTTDADPATGVDAAITEFDDTDQPLPAKLAALHTHARERPADLGAAALRHLESADRYAAIYALALTADGDAAVQRLRALLESPDTTERLIVANALVARGDKAGIPVLISLLDVRDQLRFAVPPQQAWRVARFLLVQYTGQDLGLIGADVDADRAAAARPAWERWWTEHGSELRWDAATRRFGT